MVRMVKITVEIKLTLNNQQNQQLPIVYSQFHSYTIYCMYVEQ